MCGVLALVCLLLLLLDAVVVSVAWDVTRKDKSE